MIRLGWLVVAACLVSPHAEAGKPRPATNPRFACKASDDCTNSCRHGAVNERWYTEWVAKHGDCKDGCAGKRNGSPRCIKGPCVAYDRDGKRDAGCTGREGNGEG